MIVCTQPDPLQGPCLQSDDLRAWGSVMAAFQLWGWGAEAAAPPRAAGLLSAVAAAPGTPSARKELPRSEPPKRNSRLPRNPPRRHKGSPGPLGLPLTARTSLPEMPPPHRLRGRPLVRLLVRLYMLSEISAP